MSNQFHKKLLIVSGSVLDNCVVQMNAVPPVVFFFDALQVNLCPGGNNSSKRPFLCPKLVDGQSKNLLKVFLREGQAFDCLS
ncbi:hypothetical protein ACFX2A_000317 [Malus domestica]